LSRLPVLPHDPRSILRESRSPPSMWSPPGFPQESSSTGSSRVFPLLAFSFLLRSFPLRFLMLVCRIVLNHAVVAIEGCIPDFPDARVLLGVE